MSELPRILDRLRAAARPADVFGNVGQREAHAIYRQLSKDVHPDLHPHQRDRATEALTLLNDLWDRFKKGQSSGPVVIQSGRYRYTIAQPLAAGEIADLHYAVRQDGKKVILKIVRDPANNDLMRFEHDAITRLAAIDLGPMAKVYPALSGSFMLDGRHVTVLERPEAELVAMATIIDRFRIGIDARDSVWMWKRCLGALAIIHAADMVHGAMLPPHLMIDFADHGAHLVGWTASTSLGAKIPVKSFAWSAKYPPQAPLATVDLDIYMLAGSILELTAQSTIPIGLRRVFDLCLDPEPRRRPTHALVLHQIVDSVARQCFGPPRFRRFSMGGT